MVDSTFILNPLKVPTDIALHADVTNLPDSIYVLLPDTITVIEAQVHNSSSSWWLSPEWGAIWIPTISSILVFCIGLIFESAKRLQREKAVTKSYREVIFQWTRLIIKSSSKQSELLTTFSNSISNNKYIQAERFEWSNSMADKLDIISANEVIDYFVLKSTTPTLGENKKYAYDIVSQYDFLSTVGVEIRKQYDTYYNESIELMRLWNESFSAIKAIIGYTNPSESEQILLNPVYKTYKDWVSQINPDEADINIVLAYNAFLTPLGKILNALATLDSLPMFRQLMDHYYRLSVVYKRWRVLNEGFALIFGEYSKSIADSSAMLEEAVSYFETQTKVK